jgi:hypothetical protein
MDDFDFEGDLQDQLNTLDTLIAQEEKMWEVQGINPGAITVNVYMLNMKMRMMQKLVEVKLGLSEDEMNLWFKQAVLQQLKDDRKMVTKAQAQQKLQQPGHLPFNGMLGPNGRPL